MNLGPAWTKIVDHPYADVISRGSPEEVESATSDRSLVGRASRTGELDVLVVDRTARSLPLGPRRRPRYSRWGVLSSAARLRRLRVVRARGRNGTDTRSFCFTTFRAAMGTNGSPAG